MFTFEKPVEELRVHRGPKVQRDRKMDTIRNDLIRFLKENPDYEGSTRLMAGELGCSYRTIHHYVSELTGSGALSVQKNKDAGRKQTSFFRISEKIEPKKAPVECSISALIYNNLFNLNNLSNNRSSSFNNKNYDKEVTELKANLEHLVNSSRFNLLIRILRRKDLNAFEKLFSGLNDVHYFILREAFDKAVAEWDLGHQQRRVEAGKKYGLEKKIESSRAYKKANLVYNIFHNPEDLPDYIKGILENQSYFEIKGDFWLYPESYKTWWEQKVKTKTKEEIKMFEHYWPAPDGGQRVEFQNKIKELKRELLLERRGSNPYDVDSYTKVFLERMEQIKIPTPRMFHALKKIENRYLDEKDFWRKYWIQHELKSYVYAAKRISEQKGIPIKKAFNDFFRKEVERQMERRWCSAYFKKFLPTDNKKKMEYFYVALTGNPDGGVFKPDPVWWKWRRENNRGYAD